MNTIFSALAGAERVFEVMEMEPESDEGTVTLKEEFTDGERKWYWNDNGALTPVEGNVIFDNVTFGYVPEKTVLKNVSLYAKPGQDCVCRLNRCRKNNNYKSYKPLL